MKSVTRWRVKGKLKIVLILLFLFSALFITYQFLYYTSLTRYQLQESHDNLANNEFKSPDRAETLNFKETNNNNNKLEAVSTQSQRVGIGKPIFSGQILLGKTHHLICWYSQFTTERLK